MLPLKTSQHPREPLLILFHSSFFLLNSCSLSSLPLSLVLCHPSASEPEVLVAIWMIWSKGETGNSLAVYLRACATCGALTLFYEKNKIPHSSVEKHSSSKGEGSPCASGPGFKSSEWLWTFGPVIPTAQQGWWISIPRHDGNGLQRSAGYGEIWPQRACNALQHVHPNPQCHDVWDHGGPTWSWMPAGVLSWMRVCFLMCCIEALFNFCTILWRRKICCPAHCSERMIWLTVTVQLPIIKANTPFATIRIKLSREQWERKIIRQKTTTGCMFRRKCV